MPGHDRKIAAILAADVVDYSRLMGVDEEATLEQLKQRRAIFDQLVADHGGQEFGSVGDSLMAQFPSSVEAVRCAQAIQEQMAARNAALPPQQHMQLRVGVNLGDVIAEDGAVFGDTVNVAARLQSLVKPGGVLISRAVYDQVRNKLAARFVDAGARHLKNVAEPVTVFEVLPVEPSGIAGKLSSLLARVLPRRVRRVSAVIVALVTAVALGLLWREFAASRTAQRLGAALVSHNPAGQPHSIAVLPFVNMSGDPQVDYIGDGFSEELSNRLAKVPELLVAARTSAFAFKGTGLGAREIAEKLGVRYIVEGSVKRKDRHIRVTAQLIDVTSGYHSWSNAYTREATDLDLLATEDEIATRVVTALELVLGERGGLQQRASPAAYDFYLRGLAALREPKSIQTLQSAEQLFGRALEIEPGLARAQAGLCETRVWRYVVEKDPVYVAAAEEVCANAEALDSTAQEVHMALGRLHLATGDQPEAEAAYRRALTLTPQSADALIGLAEALAAQTRSSEAEQTYQRAIAMQPRYSSAHVEYGNFLFSNGRAVDAAAEYEQAIALTPDNPAALSNLGGAYLLMGDFEKSADAFARSLALEPRAASYANTGTVHYYLGRYGEAAEMFRKAIESTPANHQLWGNLADALYFDSRPEDAKRAYRRALELADGELAVNPSHAVNQALAAYYATRLGERDRARRSIAIALGAGEGDVYVQYYVGLAELGLDDKTAALTHVRRARDLGYAENLMRAAPELAELQKML